MTEPKHQKSVFEKLILVGVLLFAFGILAVSLPSFLLHGRCTCANACINNLRQIDAAANEFALENNRMKGDVIHYPDDLTPYIKLDTNGDIPHCPDGGKYSLARVGDTPICSLGTTITPVHILP